MGEGFFAVRWVSLSASVRASSELRLSRPGWALVQLEIETHDLVVEGLGGRVPLVQAGTELYFGSDGLCDGCQIKKHPGQLSVLLRHK